LAEAWNPNPSNYWQRGDAYRSDKLYVVPDIVLHFSESSGDRDGIHLYIPDDEGNLPPNLFYGEQKIIGTYTKTNGKWFLSFPDQMPCPIRNVMATMMAEEGIEITR
jgi:hypothetical protein